MPKQSRGFWVCIFCSQAFDRFEEAKYHEVEDCPRRYLPHPAGDPQSWQQQQQQRQQQQQIQQQGYSASMPPLASVAAANPVGHRRDLSAGSLSLEKASEVRYIPILGANEPSNLCESDNTACRSIELFEIDNQTENEGSQVGLRCSFCANPSSHIFPQSTKYVSDCIRQLAEQHLTGCNFVPNAARDVLLRALKQRQQRKKEGGPSWREEEGDHKKLIEFCMARCRQVGIADKVPKNSGIIIREGSGVMSQHQPLPLSRAVPLSSPVGRRPSPQPDDSLRQIALYGDRGPMAGYPSPYDSRGHFDDNAGAQSHHSIRAYEQNTDQSPVLPDVRPGPPPAYPPFLTNYNIPPDFPFLQERGGEWICKFCSHLHPQLRDPKYYWLAPDGSPPPPDFIDFHLSVCRVFQVNRYHGFDYHSLPLQPPPPPHTPTPSFHPVRWDTPYDNEQHMSGMGGDPRLSDQQQFAAVPREGSQYEPSSYMRHTDRTAHSYPVESPLAQRFGTTAVTGPNVNMPESNAEYDRAIEFLTSNDKSTVDSDGEAVAEASMLVLEEDKLLLTDYFYFVMKQLRQVRFSEADRRTRGGKRENISIGYGGLQCVHCADLPNTRKFFWSNVDRLANSFAEIPSHVLKCRRCPQPTKDALLLLKQRHPEQMARLPRGSQKVFFRRMWRRLHDEDPPTTGDRTSPVSSASPTLQPMGPSAAGTQPVKPNPLSTAHSYLEASPAGTSGSEESIVMLQRSTEEAAKALADAAMQAGPPSPSSRVLLAVPDDHKWLSDTDCFIRRQLEVFCSTTEDVENARSDRKYPVQEGQVGIRCIHCALSKNGARGQAVAYPFSISGIYEAAREFQRLHLESCENLPPAAKSKLVTLKGSSSLSSVLRKYYVIAANALGLVDTRDGIRAGGNSVPIGSQAAFAFSEEHLFQDISPKESSESFADSSRKRPPTDEAGDSPDAKRPFAPTSPDTNK